MSTTAIPPAFAGRHVVKPLPFDPRKLTGLSERLITSHHENNYGGAMRNLIDAFFANVNWQAVNRRLETARAAHAMLKDSK